MIYIYIYTHTHNAMGGSDGNKLLNDSEKVGNGHTECEKHDGTDYEYQ